MQQYCNKNVLIHIDVHGQIFKHVMVQYWFDGDKHEVKPAPHGNGKKNRMPFRRTRQSTKDKLWVAATTMQPKHAYSQTKATIGRTYDLPSIVAAPRDPQNAWHTREEKQTFTLDFYTRDGLSDG